MKPLVIAGTLLAASLCLSCRAKPGVNTAKASVEQTLKQMERDWWQAEIKKDYAAVDRILADDWVLIDSGGSISKGAFIADLKSGASTTTSVELGPMTVRVFGNTAIVTLSDTEKSTEKGTDSSGKYVEMDVFILRNGKWQVVASQATKVQ
jgi:ketosteroid isomerase-like protein